MAGRGAGSRLPASTSPRPNQSRSVMSTATATPRPLRSSGSSRCTAAPQATLTWSCDPSDMRRFIQRRSHAMDSRTRSSPTVSRVAALDSGRIRLLELITKHPLRCCVSILFSGLCRQKSSGSRSCRQKKENRWNSVLHRDGRRVIGSRIDDRSRGDDAVAGYHQDACEAPTDVGRVGAGLERLDVLYDHTRTDHQ